MSLRKIVSEDTGDWRLLPHRERLELLADPDTPRSVVEDMARNGDDPVLSANAGAVLNAPPGRGFRVGIAGRNAYGVAPGAPFLAYWDGP